MGCPCGFDPRFFKILKEHLAQKSELQLHGLLSLDELKVRQNLLLDTTTMTYKGLEDFGENVPNDVDKKMANHGLVLMFQPLYDNYSQPIAVFASNGPTKGVQLAKLVIQAIALLEKAGAKVHGVIADGGKPNRKMWTEFGCSGKKNIFKNFFEHPTDIADDEDINSNSKFDFRRKVFFFSDAPHLIKTIRNRLANAKMLQVIKLIYLRI